MRNRRHHIALILLTHGHADHSAGARDLHARTGAPVRALDRAHRLGDEGLDDGDVVSVGGLELRVVATPGHTTDSLTFHLTADGALLDHRANDKVRVDAPNGAFFVRVIKVE